MAAVKNRRVRRLLLIWFSIFVVICCILIFRPHEHSTVYKGKTIDQWLEEGTKPEKRFVAISNLHEAGELALPDMVRVLTRRSSFFYKNIRPKLPTALKILTPIEGLRGRQAVARDTIIAIPSAADKVVTALQKAIPECDEYGVYHIVLILRNLANRDNSTLTEIAKVVPELRQLVGTPKDLLGFLAPLISEIECLIDAKVQLENWVPLNTPLQDARQILESHQIQYEEHTDKPSEPGNLLEGHYSPSGTDSVNSVHFVIFSSNYNVSSIRVLLPLPHE